VFSSFKFSGIFSIVGLNFAMQNFQIHVHNIVFAVLGANLIWLLPKRINRCILSENSRNGIWYVHVSMSVCVVLMYVLSALA